MTKIATLLKRLIRRILMNAQWLTALGAMSIPLGVVLMIGKPETAGISQWIIIAGFVFAIAGLALTFREEREKQKRESARVRREKASLMILTHIASALGVDVTKLFKDVKTLVDEYEDNV